MGLSAKSPPTLCDPGTVAHQAPLSMEFSRQEYWSGLPFPPPGYLPNPGIKSVSPELAGRFFTTELPGKPLEFYSALQFSKISHTQFHIIPK